MFVDGLFVGEVVMVEFLFVCFYVVWWVGNLVGKFVLVIGCGLIGILCFFVVWCVGVDLIVVIDFSLFMFKMV